MLDIGCGPGKFCLLGPSLTDGRFTGVEQRSELVAAARVTAAKLQIPTSNLSTRTFWISQKIDSTVPLSAALLKGILALSLVSSERDLSAREWLLTWDTETKFPRVTPVSLRSSVTTSSCGLKLVNMTLESKP